MSRDRAQHLGLRMRMACLGGSPSPSCGWREAVTTALEGRTAGPSPPGGFSGHSQLVTFYPSSVEAPRLRILFATNMWPEPGRPHYGTFIKSQADSLQESHLAVDVLAVRGYVHARAYIVGRVAVHHLARQHGYDVVHIHTGHAAAAVLPGLRTPAMISFVGGDLLGHPNGNGITVKSRVERQLFRELPRFAARTITKSEEMERALPKRLRARNHVIPNGVDTAAFAPRSKQDARRRLGWSDSELIALFLGDPEDARKNIRLAFEAVVSLRQELPELRVFSGFGTPPERIPELMWASDCLVLPSLSEGSPNVVKEAMAAALPVAATPVGDVPERLAGVDGCFVAPAELKPFAAAVRAAVAVGRAPAAREAVLPLSLQRVAARLIDVYEEVAENPSGSRLS